MIIFIKKIFKTLRLKDVFTPTKNADLTYVARGIVENDLEKYLTIPGKQIFIHGHSGSGKTSMLRKKVAEKKIRAIFSPCKSDTTYNSLLYDAFDKLEQFYIRGKSFGNESNISNDLKSEIASIGFSIKNSQEILHERAVDYQISPQKLAQILGRLKTVWIIEDFHKLNENEKKNIADIVKIFMDEGSNFEEVKIICVGAVGSARELIELENNLNNRIAELGVTLLSDDEIRKVICKGLKLLNVKMDDDLIEKIVYYSNNLASVAHQICFDICYDNNILSNKYLTRKLNENSFYNAVSSYVRKNSDTFTKIYDKINCKNYGWNILKVFEVSDRESLDFNWILNSIPEEKRPPENELKGYLDILSSPEYKEIMRFDKDSKKYSLSSPFFKAYLKMKFALDRSELNAAKKRKHNKEKFNIKVNTEFPLDDKSIEIYYKFLVKQLERNQIKHTINRRAS